ncbi:hypothetical protein, partial [Nocardia seriolae]|uniref:hypothetical protein n=5 Tax=Nocardia seriolae TaxID=37332 RepID=UPI001327F9D2
MSITSYEPAAAGGSRVYDIAVSSAADAAQKLARIHRANDLLADSPAVAVASPIGLATKPEPNMSEPGGFIGPYQQNQQYIDNGQYDKVDPNYVVPQPQPKTEQPQPQTAAPNPSKPGQPGLVLQRHLCESVLVDLLCGVGSCCGRVGFVDESDRGSVRAVGAARAG